MNQKEVIEKIRELSTDPLGLVMTCDFEVDGFVIRWGGGFVHLKRKADEFFGMPILAAEFLKEYDEILDRK